MGNFEKAIVEVHKHEGKKLPVQYLNLVRSRWMRSYRRHNDFIKLIDAASYFGAYEPYVVGVLNRPTTIVRLAVLQEDRDVVLGFSVSQGSVLHYVDVPTPNRRQGIGKSLVPQEIGWFSHITRIGMKIWPSKFPNAKFSPFI